MRIQSSELTSKYCGLAIPTDCMCYLVAHNAKSTDNDANPDELCGLQDGEYIRNHVHFHLLTALCTLVGGQSSGQCWLLYTVLNDKSPARKSEYSMCLSMSQPKQRKALTSFGNSDCALHSQ
jgi:hypothetical protein